MGYLAAGVLIGPFTPGFVANRAQIAALSEVGALLLMFALGMAFRSRNWRALRDTPSTRAQAPIRLRRGSR
ncbi:MAG: cation:proton antiporter [Armatimonadetes bacterium]|nr:cation:proton antiporter [Armatimonadota bacterium]